MKTIAVKSEHESFHMASMIIKYLNERSREREREREKILNLIL